MHTNVYLRNQIKKWHDPFEYDFVKFALYRVRTIMQASRQQRHTALTCYLNTFNNWSVVIYYGTRSRFTYTTLTGICVEMVVCLDSNRIQLSFILLRNCYRHDFNMCTAYVVLLAHDYDASSSRRVWVNSRNNFSPFQVQIQRPKYRYCSDIADCSQIAAFIPSLYRPIFWPQQHINT